MISDTICAISTAVKDGAISIVRLSGPLTFDIIEKISTIKKDTIVPNTIRYSHIIDNNKIIDEVLISFFKQGKSFTMEDMAEINCHGGSYVTSLILEICLTNGARLANCGEFTMRAYLNGRIDLSQAESINDLINAKNNFQLQSSQNGLNGSISKLLNPIIDEINNLICTMEVNIDYPEYEDEKQILENDVKTFLNSMVLKFNTLIDEALRFKVIKDGLNTVIVGKPNVGKSSLLNAFLNESKAIVTDIEGTTRDIVEGQINLKHISLNLIDTAGIRDTENVIEKIGIEKSKEVIEKADFVIVLQDASNIDEKDKDILEFCKDKDHVIVYNKSDLNSNVDGIKICAKDLNIDELINYLNNKFCKDFDLINKDVLNNQRQISLMKLALNEYNELLNIIDDITLDIALVYIRRGYKYLLEILGKDYSLDIIDNMFKNFCLGK